jgi:multicomponent K+:H+ antiporter subunit G
MSMMWELAISICLLIGAGFALLGAIGLLKLPDFLCRLHAPTAATTLGIGATMLGSLLFFAVSGAGASWHALLLTLFLTFTAPISAHLLAKAALHLQRESRGPE